MSHWFVFRLYGENDNFVVLEFCDVAFFIFHFVYDNITHCLLNYGAEKVSEVY